MGYPVDELSYAKTQRISIIKLYKYYKRKFSLFFTDEEKLKKKNLIIIFEDLIKNIKSILGDSVEKVVLSQRLKDSPPLLVTPEYGWSALWNVL